MRLCRGGWKVPAQIVCDERGWHAIIDGAPLPPHPDPGIAEQVAYIWQGAGELITEDEYVWLLLVKTDAQLHEPDHPSLHPHRSMHPNRLRPISWRGY